MEYYKLTSSAGIKEMESKLAGDNSPQAQKLVSYMKKALPEMTLKMAKDNFTTDDLKVGINLTSNPLAQRYIKASSHLSEEAMQPMMEKLAPKMSKIMMGQ